MAIDVAIATGLAGLHAALRGHADMPPSAPIRVIHGTGRAATSGAAPVRAFMRDAGFIDSKVTAVSALLTATRYGTACVAMKG